MSLVKDLESRILEKVLVMPVISDIRSWKLIHPALRRAVLDSHLEGEAGRANPIDEPVPVGALLALIEEGRKIHAHVGDFVANTVFRVVPRVTERTVFAVGVTDRAVFIAGLTDLLIRKPKSAETFFALVYSNPTLPAVLHLTFFAAITVRKSEI